MANDLYFDVDLVISAVAARSRIRAVTYESFFLVSRRLLHEFGEQGQGSTGGSSSRDSS